MFRNISRLVLLPSLSYLFIFCILTWPLVTTFSDAFWADDQDGVQNVWNMWWTREAVQNLQNPWRTTMLHHPDGVTLLAHTLNPFNGFCGTLLQLALDLRQSYNFMVLFSFTVGGLTAFLLAYSLTSSWVGSFLAGYIFTFSSFHFAHARTHMQMTSLEWIPLFVLFWHLLLNRPLKKHAAASGVCLFLVLLCDYYFFLYCVIAGMLMVGWQAIRSRDPLFLIRPSHRGAFSTFMVTAVALCAPIVVPLLHLTTTTSLSGTHSPWKYFLDLPALLIPGGHWRFSALTRPYWRHLPGNIDESSVHLGLAVILTMIIVLLARRRIRGQLGPWFLLIAGFGILALGPRLHVWGQQVLSLRLPYAYLAYIVPFLRTGGVPVRMVVMVVLAAGVICAFAWRDLARRSMGHTAAALALIGLMVFETLPDSLPANEFPVPDHVKILAAQPTDGLIDLAHSKTMALYWQTIHHKPMAFGYISRVPWDVELRDQEITRLIANRDWAELGERYHLVYLLTREGDPLDEVEKPDQRTVVYRGEGVTLSRLRVHY